jgi:hypothetical protein
MSQVCRFCSLLMLQIEAFRALEQAPSRQPPPPPPQQQQQQHQHHRPHDHFHQQESLHAPPPPLPVSQHNPRPPRTPDLYLTWKYLHQDAPKFEDACVRKLFAAAGFPQSNKISWMTQKFRDGSSSRTQACFVTVADLEQLDRMLRLCMRDPRCVEGYDVNARPANSGLAELVPEVYLRFSLPRNLRGGTIGNADVVSIARDAGLPEPVSIKFLPNFDECYLRYIIPRQAEAFIAHCHKQPVFHRDGTRWNVDCSYAKHE